MSNNKNVKVFRTEQAPFGMLESRNQATLGLDLVAGPLSALPSADPTKIGQRFWYRGNEWFYAPAELLEAWGLSSTYEPGAPLPVDFGAHKIVPFSPVVGANTIYSNSDNGKIALIFSAVAPDTTPIDLDFRLSGRDAVAVTGVIFDANTYPRTVGTILGAEILRNLQDIGTAAAFLFRATNGATQVVMTGAQLNAFFTALPATTKTATINIAVVSGKASATTSIATGKGYTVVT